ncbi:MAG: type IV pili methyl-accepting chemotaxis transducer N-terminal domain-containing protein [Deltaproteobacteria bacterium]|nr:type IV pili methyl-accepting chemotaxis transducer N-terminal domain-containing protein [Deltaproteobacteria bacterium]MBW2418284.1 type IV pili methyl-accepting chemotaxis transducer N-terminal domain-containing protein [Deltaproteobacteria bacterium]
MRQITLILSCVSALFLAQAEAAELLPYEVGSAEGTAGRVRRLAQQLSKDNLLYQLHLGDVHKSDLVATTAQIDRNLEMLAEGSTTFGVPAPWTPEIREQVRGVHEAWQPLRAIATASPYEYLRRTRQFMAPESGLGDPLSIRYFDNLSLDLVAEAEKLIALYDQECRKTTYRLCDAAAAAGLSEMLIERSTKEAVLVFAGIDVDRNKKRLKESVAAFQRQRVANEESDLLKAALALEQGKAGEIASQLIDEIRKDWDGMRAQFDILLSGKTPDFDLYLVLKRQRRTVENIERFTIVMSRFINRNYGA